jgi:membrane-bound serine protease (ClpP class)
LYFSTNLIITIIVVVIIGLALLAMTIVYGIRAHRRQVSAGREDLVGRIAEARTVIEPRGTVFVEGESWAAILDKGRVEPGEEVIITKVEGLRLRVTRKD